MAGLASLFGGGFGGNDSSVAASTPFYNESGIYFRSPDSGNLSGASSEANATTTPRQTAGLNQAIPDSMIPLGDFSAQPSGNIIYYIIGAVILLGVGAYLAFKKS